MPVGQALISVSSLTDGGVPDQRVVVQALKDLVVRHAAPWVVVPVAEAGREAVGPGDERRCELCDACCRQAVLGPGDRERGHGLAARVADGGGHRREARLELADGDGVAAHARPLELADSGGGGIERLRTAPKARKTLPTAVVEWGTRRPIQFVSR